MTTAHRPTWQQAMGGESQGGNRMSATGKQSARDLPGHKSLKTRHASSSVAPSLSRKSDAKRSLDDREVQHRHKQQRIHTLSSASSSRPSESSAPAAIENNVFPEDADDEGPALGGEDSSDDEEAELRRELEAIKQERLEEERKKKMEYDKEHEDETRDKILRGNPLLSSQPVEDADQTVGIERAWDDDVVFKNQTKGRLKQKKTFINDAVRSDFHKKFMTKYIV
eukprot:GHVS01058329.1.p1 GENE.GHVS01058329.1~~GHVS01058329.1.p1  ORF type:complete len:225 (+),score=51.50 GHVS01058329.1:78-752(+)